MYKDAKNMTGKQTVELFARYGVMDYVMSCYGALSTVGHYYLMDDIDGFIEDRR